MVTSEARALFLPYRVKKRKLEDMTDTAIPLNDQEANLKRLLLDVAEHIEQDPPPAESVPNQLAEEPLTLRFTGGWVRDKLLGLESHDVDVGINKLTGYQFGLRLQEYLDAPGNAAKYGLEGAKRKAGSLTKIEANPDKSKHLETVTSKILGLEVDLVNLRKETYTSDSRNPQMEFGTAKEDALRRDATINAMFYNLNTSSIEDFTEQGLQDLKAGLIRTPLEPYTTFKDDPLRVLRLIRFACRLGYRIDDHALGYMAHPDIREALKLKITKERIWMELEKILRGQDPRRALEFFDSLNLYSTIFTNPTGENVQVPDTGNWRSVYDALAMLLKDASGQFGSFVVHNEEESFLAWVVATMTPWITVSEPSPPTGAKTAPPIAVSVARESLKAPNKVTDLINLCVRNLEEIKSLKDRQVTARDTLGMAIRTWGPTWRLQVLSALLVEILETPGAQESKYISEVFRRLLTFPELIFDYTRFTSATQELGIAEAYNLRPLLDGKSLSRALATPPGPWMKSALDIIMAWQLRNPEVTDQEVLLDSLKASEEFKSISTTPNSPPPFLAGVHLANASHTSRALDDSVSHPWKFPPNSIWVFPLLTWICRALDSRTVEKEWGALIPTLLSILDDTDTKTRALGADLVCNVMAVTPSGLLVRTGLAQLFLDSLYISVTYLPTLTPEDEATTIIGASIPAILAVTNVAYPNDPPVQPQRPDDHFTLRSPRVRALTTLLRQGILHPLSVCPYSTYPRLAVVLLGHLPTVLDALEVHSVVHLKGLVPLLTGILADPLVLAMPELTHASLLGLEAVMRNARPRVEVWRGDIAAGLGACWVQVSGERNPSGETANWGELRKQLRGVFAELRATVHELSDGKRFEGEIHSLLEAEPELKGMVQ
ncbi:poly A polymerase C-terminal region-like protein [Trichodelitschia bisporula]|uniref:Poly A polymerase C-terminal region-like protein n=1 Tax=Trichodelitschia bisporula TaxID=703511 RepID=A0A6G1IAN0_9PEZI|nr:poly A polymerase C-terminal region-like protein [Trichodelitschia bisporula]